MSVSITETNLKLIKTRLAYPSTDKILLTDDQLKEFVIKHALDDYFVKFPKITEVSQVINGEVELEFPDDYTFGALDVRIVEKGYTSSTGSSFWDIVAYQALGGSSLTRNSMYRSKVKGYNPNSLRQQRIMNRIVNDSFTNQGTFKYRVNQDDRIVYVYSSLSAKLNITWAKWSEDFSDVHFQFKWDVIKLCQAYFMQYIADTAGMIVDSAQEVLLDSDKLMEKADKILEEIREKWNEYPAVVIMNQ